MGNCHSCCQTNLENETRKFQISKNTKITISLFVIIFSASFIVPQFSVLKHNLLSYIKMVWWPMLLGFVISGLIDFFIPEDFIFYFLGGRKKRIILLATFLGFLLSACSHGILAISMQLYKKGASIPSVISFLLASPWANFPVTILLFYLFGWRAFLFIIAAIFIAITTGYIFMFLESVNLIEKSKSVELKEKFSWKDFKSMSLKDSFLGIIYSIWSITDMLAWWLIIGLLIASFIGAFVPAHIFSRFFGPSILGLLATLAFATIIEVCSEGSAPIAFELFRKTGAFGNPLVFLLAGVATDYTEIGLIWTTIGKKTAIWLPIVTVPQIIIFGFLFNHFVR